MADIPASSRARNALRTQPPPATRPHRGQAGPSPPARQPHLLGDHVSPLDDLLDGSLLDGRGLLETCGGGRYRYRCSRQERRGSPGTAQARRPTSGHRHRGRLVPVPVPVPSPLPSPPRRRPAAHRRRRCRAAGPPAGPWCRRWASRPPPRSSRTPPSSCPPPSSAASAPSRPSRLIPPTPT